MDYRTFIKSKFTGPESLFSSSELAHLWISEHGLDDVNFEIINSRIAANMTTLRKSGFLEINHYADVGFNNRKKAVYSINQFYEEKENS